jgi:endogenous inhibitor of DNA gyrase (YacG/DUF329 family)
MTCPICASPPVQRYRPFCSARCAEIDLGRWVTGAYAVPSSDPEDAAEAAERLARRPPDDGRDDG